MRDKPVTAQQLFRLIEVEIVDLEQDIASLRKKIDESRQERDGAAEKPVVEETNEVAHLCAVVPEPDEEGYFGFAQDDS